MKTTSNNCFAQISSTTLEALTKEVKETIATDCLQNQHKNFSAAELWNIQRQRKTRVQRRYM